MTKQFKLQPLIFIGLGIAVFIIVLSRQCCQPSPLPLSEAIIVSQFEELVEGDFEQGANFFRNNMMAEGEILLNSPLTGKQAVFSLEEFLGYRSNFERVSLYFISSAFFDKITELTILELPKAPFISQLLGALADQDIPDQERRKYADQLLLIIEKTAEVSIGGKKLAFNTYLEGLYHGTTPPGEVASLGDLRSSKYGSLFINPAIAGYIPKQENPPTLVPKGGTKTRPYIPEYPPDTIILSKPTSVDTSTTQPPQPSFDEEAFKDRIKGILEKNFNILRSRGNKPGSVPESLTDQAIEKIESVCRNNNIPVVFINKEQSITPGEEFQLSDYIDVLYEIKMTDNQRRRYEKSIKISDITIDKLTRKVIKVKISNE